MEKRYQLFIEKNLYPRELQSYDIESSIYLTQAGKRYLNFSSNDYLGLARHPLLIARTQEFAKKWGVGSASSRLVAGNSSLFDELENQLAVHLKKPAAIILGAGYQTNFTVLECLLDNKILNARPLVYCDRWSHASLISSIQHHAEIKRFKHNDLIHLRFLLEKYSDAQTPQFIIAESLYSMDGDQSNLAELVSLAKEFNALLYVDDAHTVGVAGEAGFGKATAYPVDIIMGTFSKGLGSFGGYIGCSSIVKEYLVNKCRGLIYSTALPIPILGAISAALELIPQLNEERERLNQYAQKMLTFFRENQLNCGTANSHIIPWIINNAAKAQWVSAELKKSGILGVTIRPPSVPVGQSRIRFCLSAAHENEHIDQLIDAIKRIKEQW